MLRNPTRTTRWSSAIKTRITSGRAMVGVGMVGTNGHFDPNFRPSARPASHVEPGAHLPGSFVHPQQPEMGAVGRRQPGKIESLSVILNPHGHTLFLIVQFDANFSSARVFQRIGNGFLAD